MRHFHGGFEDFVRRSEAKADRGLDITQAEGPQHNQAAGFPKQHSPHQLRPLHPQLLWFKAWLCVQLSTSHPPIPLLSSNLSDPGPSDSIYSFLVVVGGG